MHKINCYTIIYNFLNYANIKHLIFRFKYINVLNIYIYNINIILYIIYTGCVGYLRTLLLENRQQFVLKELTHTTYIQYTYKN